MGKIFDIQRFCVHDGPGIRTTVFLKGCPLRCQWCHNPESQHIDPLLALYSDKCVLCGKCASVCPTSAHIITEDGHLIQRDKCVACGKCAAACPADALEIMGRDATAREIMDEVMRDATFYKTSGGGLTVSGGEPFFQPELLLELLTLAKAEGLHTCIETSGFAAPKTLEAAIPLTDLFLFDYKASGEELHRRLIGAPQKPILDNLRLIDRLGGKTVLRCPIIPDVNLTDEHLRSIAELAVSLDNAVAVNVMAYHTLGNSKYTAVGMTNPLPDLPQMSPDQKKECVSRLRLLINELSGGAKNIPVE